MSLESRFALALETSGSVGSVAIGRGREVLEARSFPSARQHAADLLPAIDALCRAQGASPQAIAAVYVSIGPGSFTGLRIGLAAARMLALAVGSRLVGVSSLEAAAQNALAAEPTPKRVAVIVDAGRGRVYGAAFARHGDRYVVVQDAAEVEPSAFLAAQGGECAVLGEGVELHRAAVEASRLRVLPVDLLRSRAEAVFRLGAEQAAEGRFDEARRLVPVYIRPPEAEEKRAASAAVVGGT